MRGMKATKIPGFLLEPISSGPSASWEGHHATNPCAIRLSGDPRVFLGYRAGGDDDAYTVGHHRVWGSHLGLAVLDPGGETVACRLPLPIFRLEHGIRLPQSREEYERFIQSDDLHRAYILHDFRFLEYGGFLCMVYHQGPVNDAYDCVVRMPVRDFLAKVARSEELSRLPVEAMTASWRDLWWREGTWEPCGIGGSNRIFGSRVHKGDIVYFELASGALQMCHRPLASGCAALDVGDKLYADTTADGLTTYGTFESNTRPGFTDNSHIGNNGAPTRARIGSKDVLIDVTHGCWSNLIATGSLSAMDVMYYAYLRVKDRRTGELLYYSEDPIIDYGKDWNRQAMTGTWVSGNPALQGVMFAGGQVERVAGHNGLDDDFLVYVGLGDTAVGLARFRLRDLLPGRVIADIENREADLARAVAGTPADTTELPGDACGWRWELRNHAGKRTVMVHRRLPATGESASREINSRPGYFDAHGLAIAPSGVLLDEELQAWVIAYQGIRLLGQRDSPHTQVGHGLLILSRHNPEQVYYRSTLPVSVETLPGWRFSAAGGEARFLPHYRDLVPARTMDEIRNLAELRRDGLPYMHQFERWLKEKSGQERPSFWPTAGLPAPEARTAAADGQPSA